jgi:triosephosphate isomerase
MAVSGQRALLAANWKMNPLTAPEAAELVRQVAPAAAQHPQVDVVLFPPFTWLLGVAELLDETRVGLGAQDCYWEKSGAYTGEISPQMLAGWCDWVIVGHSERRAHFSETDQDVARKLGAALAAGLRVIVCVGELDEHYQEGRTQEIVRQQLLGSLAEAAADDSERLVVAYEPVWAIGSGKNADPEHAYKTMRLIRTQVAEVLGAGAARRVRVLYGGSVNADNIESYVELPMCDGCLVGSASLKGEEFSRMIATTAEVYGSGVPARPQA